MIAEPQIDLGANGFDSIYPEPRSEHVPYAALTGVFAALLLLAGRARRGDVEHPVGLFELACLGLASHDVAQIVARDRIAVFLRAPFASGEAAQYPRGDGMRRAVGELLTCPHCLSLWVGAAFAAGLVRFPRHTRFVATVFAGHGVARTYEWAWARLTR